MRSYLFKDKKDISRLRELITSLGAASTMVDFEEKVQMPSILEALRLYEEDGRLVGFAFVDNYNNLYFDTLPDFDRLEQLESGCIAWGVCCLQAQNARTGSRDTLDSSCSAGNERRVRVLEQHGFIRTQVRSLHYSRPLDDTLPDYPLPAGFLIRPVNGRDEVEALVELHRQAFASDHMTVEERLAIMNSPEYIPELDLVVVSPEDLLAAFCICGYSDPDKKVGYTDPIGTHPRFQRLGLARAVVTAGMQRLKNAGAQVVELGMSSENSGMQKLAEELGFSCISEKLWFSRQV